MAKRSRISWEKQTVQQLIGISCRGHRHPRNGRGELCPACADLLKYAEARLERCPFGEQKTFCGSCRIHCYEPKRREEIRQVMRYAGPRLLLVDPFAAVRHLIGR